ncbi:MAG: DegT/DnrJ/EryC1/StrS family aminotransferase [Candidatus Latescibacterota bacterium]
MPKLALHGGAPVRRDPFTSWPVHDDSEREALGKVLESGEWWYGEQVRAFEEQFAAYQDARFGITAANGTAALQIALTAAGIGAGDEVIVPPYTFLATASAVLMANAVPVFADIDRDTLCISPERIREAITEKTRAIIPVHLGGLPADMDAIGAIANEHDLVVIEDACHAWGSEWKGRKVGAIGDMGCFSFQASKNITSAEGGIILTNDEGLADQCRSYTNCGRGKDTPWYEHYLLGGNYRITEFQAALLLCQLARLDEHVTIRQHNARLLNAGFADIGGVAVHQEDSRSKRRSYHMLCFRFVPREWEGVSRERFIEAVRAEGIPISSGYPHPLYRNPLFERKGEGPKFCPLSCPYYGKAMDYSKVFCPNVEQVCAESLWLGQSMLLGSESDMADILSGVAKVWEGRDALKN